jgi:hypothetical protein
MYFESLQVKENFNKNLLLNTYFNLSISTTCVDGMHSFYPSNHQSIFFIIPYERKYAKCNLSTHKKFNISTYISSQGAL